MFTYLLNFSYKKSKYRENVPFVQDLAMKTIISERICPHQS